MNKLALLFIVVFNIGCGGLNDYCKDDGTCAYDNLECDGHKCILKPTKSIVKEKVNCKFESDCFCESCAEHCRDTGIKICMFNHRPTFCGSSKPSVCECKE
jgi:hypothetical protein